MNILYSVLIFLFLFQAAGLQAEVLTLKKSIEIALKNYPGTLKYKNALKASEQRVKSRLSSFFPEISLALAYSHKGGEYLNDSTGQLQNYESSSYGVSLNFNQLLFTKFSTYFAYKIAQVEKLMEENNLKQAETELIFNIKELYFSLILYQKQMVVLKQIVERRKQNYTIAKISYEAGKEKITSVMEAEASVKQSEYDLMEKTESYKVSKSILNVMMGLEEEKDWELEKQAAQDIKAGLNTIMQKARENSPKLKSVRQRSEIEEMGLKSYWSEYLPSLSFSASYGYSDTRFFPKYNNWSYGFSLSIPIFSGNSTQYKIEESKAKLESLNNENRLTIQELESNLKSAYKKYLMAQKKQELLSLKLKTAKSSYRLTRLEYQQGKTSYLWLEQKENELSTLETEVEQNQYQLKLYFAELEKLSYEDFYEY